ncbi:MAG: heme ABC transporter ATP-binding protein [Burkholderiales bacterium]
MLAAAGITVVAGGATLLREVSIALAPGELVALLGENGAGKSTLLKTLAGDLVPRAGSVTMNGRPLRDWRLRERARLRAVLPQSAALAFGFSALETVLLGRHPHSDGVARAHDVEIARAALEQLDAAHLAGRLVTTLSGGELARVQLARVLAQLWPAERSTARYLLLDEPVASLDPAHQHLTLRVARSCAHEDGAGVLAVLHDINLAAQYADRVVLLKQGRVLAEGPPEAVFTPQALGDCFNVEATVVAHPRFSRPLVVVSA